ncbi:MAG: DNA topoisomerase VI subunit B [Pyrodictiaceae archaeon]
MSIDDYFVEETYKSMTPSQFFYEYREIAGFSNPARALYQTVRELVENALDATDVYGIKPIIKIEVKQDDDNPLHYRISVEDNGVGIDPQYVPYAFGKVLFSSKYKLRQARGRFGLGAKMAILYGQVTTGKPVKVYTAQIGSRLIYGFKLKIDIERNEPIIVERSIWRNSSNWHGVHISVTILGDWPRARSRVLEYLKRTAIVTPYAEIFFKGPDGEIVYYKRVIEKLPARPSEVKPHPHGVDIELLKQLIKQTEANTILGFLIQAFQGVGKRTAEKFLEYAKIDPELDPKSLGDRELEYLARKLKEYPKFRAPSAESLSPLGKEVIEAGLKAILKPEFVIAVTRKPRAYEGHPFIVEVGIAYGGNIPSSQEPILLRYANRIPLLYDEKSDVAWKVVDPRNFDWRQYMVVFPAPIAVLTHICSTKIPYKGVGKESVAEVPEIEHELRSALKEAARGLRRYLLEKKKEEETRKRITAFMKYAPEVAKSLSLILGSNGIDENTIKEMLIKGIVSRFKLNESELKKLMEGFEVRIEE